MFDAAHLHLMLNHFPIIGTLIGGVLMAYALLRSDRSLQKVVLVMWVVLAAMTPAVMKTGEEAEEKAEHTAGISEDVIHEHEEAAEVSHWLMVTLGLASLITLLTGDKIGSSRNKTLFTFVTSLVVIAAMIRTGYLGGQIRHSKSAGATVIENVGDHEGEHEH